MCTSDEYTLMHVKTDKNSHTHMHTRTHTHAHTHTHNTHAHTHTHIHTQHSHANTHNTHIYTHTCCTVTKALRQVSGSSGGRASTLSNREISKSLQP